LGGLWLSWLLDTPSGPTIALSLTLWGVASVIYRPTEARPSE